MRSQDKPDDLLARFPGPVTLRPSRTKWLLILLGSIAFTATGAWMVADGKTMGWFALVFFGLCAIPACAALLPGAGGLKLDRDGIEVTNMFRRHSYRWQDVTGFEAVGVPPSGTRMVVFDFAGAAGKTIAKLNVGLVGRNAALPDTYGLSADVLAGLMARWRERAVT
jgi:hypothetical protein